MALTPFVDRLGLRCRVNDHALKFLPEIQQMADLLAARMRNRIGRSNPYMALHLRFEKGMVGLSFCYFLGTREEKASMAENRKRNGHGGISISAEWFSSVATSPAEAKGRRQCPPLEPGEVAVILYVASGQVYGGKNRMAPLRNIFPNGERWQSRSWQRRMSWDKFRKHVTSLAALDFFVCLKSDVLVMTHGGNFAKLIIGARRYMGHRQKSIKPVKGLLSKSFGDPYMGWATFAEDIIVTHQTRTGLREETFPNYDLWENPLTPCMCKA